MRGLVALGMLIALLMAGDAAARLNPGAIDQDTLEKIAANNRRAVVRIETLQYFPSSVAQDVREVADSSSYLGAAGRTLWFIGTLPFKTLWGAASLAMHPTELASSRSVGSGFIVDSNGEVLTAQHVIEGADSIQVEVPEVGTFSAALLGSDRDTDLALLQITNDRALHFEALKLGDSDELKPGQFVMAMGSPFGLQQSVSAGIVSAVGLLGADQRNSDMIQHDAGINPGSSGGPLFDLKGDVVGINSSIASRGNDVGFAIPINVARNELDDLRRGQKHDRAYLGVTFEPISLDMAKEYQLTSGHGVRLVTVEPDSPAAQSGLRVGDLVTGFGGKPIVSSEDFFRAINRVPPGTAQKVEYLREGSKAEARVVPAGRPHSMSIW